MNNLYIYACSYGKYGTSNGPKAHKWVDQESFGDFLAKSLNLNLVNRSYPGGCNYHIFKNIMKDVLLGNFDNTDTILVQWTYLGRAYHNDQEKTVMPNNPEFFDYYKNYYNDLQSLCNLLTFNFYVKNKIKCPYYFTVVENLQDLSKINELIFQEIKSDPCFLTIKNMSPIEYLKKLDNKELMLECHHPSVKGHKLLSEIFYQLMVM